MYYKVLMEGGHMGAGKSYDMVRYFQADSLLSVFDILSHLPRLKTKGAGKSVKQIEPVSKREYVEGRWYEKKDPYLTRH